MNELKRYDLDAESSSIGGYVEMKIDDYGSWVMFSDVKPALDESRARIKELEHTIACLRNYLSEIKILSHEALT